MNDDTRAAFVFHEVKHTVNPDDSLEDRCTAAFKAVKSHWMALDEEPQFAGALVAVFETATDEEKERLKAEVAAMKALRAAVDGVPVDFSRALEGFGEYEPIGLNKLWREA